MSDTENLPSWRKKFLASRMTFESILFERELVAPKPQKKYTGILVLAALFLFHALLLWQAVLRGGSTLPKADAAVVEAAYKYSAAVDAGNYYKLFKPELFVDSGISAPVYYLAFYPPFKLFPANPAAALAAVNSFFLLIIMLALYSTVRKARNAPSGWLAASFAAAMPFIVSLGRHASPELAVVAFVTASYCSYMNSETFESRKWSLLFGLSFCLGLLSGGGFVVCVIPLLPFALNAFLNPLTRNNVKPFYALLLLAPGAWYLRNAVFSVFQGVFVRNDLAAAAGIGSFGLFNPLTRLPDLLVPMHAVLLALGALSLVWLAMSVFMAYAEKEVVFSWFLIPYCLLTIFSSTDPAAIYPALMPMALAAGIMIPNKVRKPLLGLTLVLALVYQSGFVQEMTAKVAGRRLPVFGMGMVNPGGLKLEEALKTVHDAAAGRPVRVQLVGDDPYFNIDTLTLLARKLGYREMLFVTYPKDFMGFADFVLYKTGTFAMPYQSGPFQDYAADIAAPGGWFSTVFKQAASFETADTSRLVVYSKAGYAGRRLAPGNYSFPKFTFGGMTFEDAVVDVGPFDEASGSYRTLDLFVPHFDFHGMPMYSLRFRFSDLSLVPLTDSFSEVRLTGCTAATIRSLKMREEALSILLKSGSQYFQNLSVKLEDGLSILGSYHGVSVNLGFSVHPTGAGFKVKLFRMLFGGVGSEITAAEQPDESAAGTDPLDETEPDDVTRTDAAGTASEEPVGRTKMPTQAEMAQFTGDTAMTNVVKASGYDKLITRVAAISAKGKAAAAGKKPAQRRPAPPPPSGSVVSRLLVGLFSMDFDFLDEKTVPFKLKVGSLTMHNGLLVVH